MTYRRVLLKMSGEALMGEQSFGIDKERIERLARSVLCLMRRGLEVAIVIGGGNIFRGIKGVTIGIDRVPADNIGMLATVINGMLLQQIMLQLGCDARVMSAIDVPQLAEPYVWERAVEHLERGRLVIFVGGTGNPYFTTDTAAALRASEIHADLLMKATKVNGIYDKDPLKHPDAKRYERLTYSQVLVEKLGVMDLTAITLCMNNSIPIVVFDILSDDYCQYIEKPALATLVQE